MQWDYTLGPAEVVLLQRQLFNVQENVRTKEKRADKGVRETREETERFEGARPIQKTGCELNIDFFS